MRPHPAAHPQLASCKGVPRPRAWGMEHLISLEERDKAGVLLSQVHWTLATYSLPFNLDNQEVFGFYKIITR